MLKKLLLGLAFLLSAASPSLAAFPADLAWPGTVTAPTLTQPAYLATVAEPTLGTQITRISGSEMTPSNNLYLQHAYSKIQPWNSDMTFVMLSGAVFILNASDYTVYKEWNYHNDARWSTVEPNVLFYTTGNRFRKVNVVTEVDTLLYDFCTSTPFNCGGIHMGPDEGNISIGDGMVVFTIGQVAIVYNIATSTVVSSVNIGTAGSDWVSMSASGTYVIVGSNTGGGVHVYNTSLAFVRTLNGKLEHGDSGYDLVGNEVFVQTCSDKYIRLSNAASTSITPAGCSGHLSTRNYDRDGWAYMTHYGMVYAKRLDTTNITERFAYHRSTENNYDSQAKGTVSPDGTKMMFNSNWGTSGAAVYAYVAEVSTTSAHTYYIATTGNDTTGTGAIGAPWLTFSKANTMVVAGDTVYARGGTYAAYVTLTASGTAVNRITFQSYPGETAIINGSGTSPGTQSFLLRINGDYVTVKDLEVKNAAWTSVIFWNGADYGVADDLVVHDSYRQGIVFYRNFFGTAQNNLVYNTYDAATNGGNADCISMSDDGVSTVGGNHSILNNIVHDCGDDGIDMWQTPNNTITGNLSYHNGWNYNNGASAGNGNGYKLGPGGSNTVTDNIAWNNRSRGFDDNTGPSNRLYNNTAINNGSVNYRMESAGGILTNNISSGSLGNITSQTLTTNSWQLGITNLQFLQITDPAATTTFARLGSGSPAINVGTTVSGSAHTCIGICDLGRYEYITVADTTPPSVPVVTVSVNNAAQITISYPASTDASGVVGYDIKYCTPGACTPGTALVSVNAATLSFAHTGLSASTQYCYSVSARDGAGNASAFSTAACVTTTSTFRRILGFETFSVADGSDIGANWDAGYTSLQPFKIVSQRILPTQLSVTSIESYNAVVAPDDQWIQATLSIYSPTNTNPSVLCRVADSPTFSAYEFQVNTNGLGVWIRKYTAGASSTLLTASTSLWQQTDKLAFECKGTALSGYRVRGQSRTLMISTTDPTFASGKWGLKNFEPSSLPSAQMDDVVVGDFSVSAPTPPAMSTIDATSTNMTITYTGSPQFFRIETATLSVVARLAEVVGGVYTFSSDVAADVVSGGSVKVCPRDAADVEYTAGCLTDNSIAIPIVDTTAPTMTSTTTTDPLPEGTTSHIISMTTSEAASATYGLTNLAYGDIDSFTMNCISLTCSATVIDLTDGSITHYYAQSRDVLGNTTTSSLDIVVEVDETTADTTPPGTVTNLTSTALSEAQVEWVWTAASGGDVASYELYLCTPSPCTEYVLAKQVVGTTSTSTALLPLTSYAGVVKAVDTSGNKSAAFSDQVTVTTLGITDNTPPSIMTNLTANGLFANSILLFATAGTDNVAVTAAVFEQSAGATCASFSSVPHRVFGGGFLIENLTAGTTRCFRGKWTDGANLSTSFSNEVLGTTLATGLLTRPRQQSLGDLPVATQQPLTTTRAARN